MKATVAFTADGKGYTLCLDYNALCDLTEVFPDLMTGGAKLTSPKAVRTVFFHALRRYQSEITEEQAGDIIQAVGLGPASELLGQAFKASFPDTEEAGKADENPPVKRSRGRGN